MEGIIYGNRLPMGYASEKSLGISGLGHEMLTVVLPFSGSEQLYRTPLNEANTTEADCFYYNEKLRSD